MNKTNMKEVIKKLELYRIEFDQLSNSFLRVYLGDNDYTGLCIEEGQIVIFGKIIDEEDFEKLLYRIA